MDQQEFDEFRAFPGFATDAVLQEEVDAEYGPQPLLPSALDGDQPLQPPALALNLSFEQCGFFLPPFSGGRPYRKIPLSRGSNSSGRWALPGQPWDKPGF